MFMSPFDSFMFKAGPIFIFIIFAVIIIAIIGGIITSAKKKVYNDRQPILNVDATIVARRADTTVYNSHTHNNQHMSSSRSRTTYFVTFQFESGDRLELEVPEAEYGYLVEGDAGELKFQGTRFLAYTRS